MGALAITLLLLVTPVAQSVTSRITITSTPPYSGKPYVVTSTSTIGCSVSGSFWKAPAMNLTTGMATVGSKSHAKSCASGSGTDTETVATEVGLYTKSFTTTSATHKLTVHWKITWNSTLVATPFPLLTSHAVATSYLAVVAYVFDVTTSSSITSSNSWLAINVTTSGSHTYHHTSMVSLFINGTFVSTHVYQVVTFVYAVVSAITGDTGTSTADANLNIATLGNGAKLTSIVRV